jgi:hypothetical protein
MWNQINVYYVHIGVIHVSDATRCFLVLYCYVIHVHMHSHTYIVCPLYYACMIHTMYTVICWT